MEEDLIKFLFQYAHDHGIDCSWESLDAHKPAYAVVNYNFIIVNKNWFRKTEIPFTLAHEIGHVLNGDIICNCQSRYAVYPCERNADRYAFDLIFIYSLRYGSVITEPGIFIEQYGIPPRMLDYATEVFAKNRSLLLEA